MTTIPQTFDSTFEIHHILPTSLFNNKEFGDKLEKALGDRAQLQSGNNRIAMFTTQTSADMFKDLQSKTPELRNIEVAGTWHWGLTQGGHTGYTNAVQDRLEQIFAEDSKLDPKQQRLAVIDLQATLKQMLIDGTVDIYGADSKKNVEDYLKKNAISNEEIIKNSSDSEKVLAHSERYNLADKRWSQYEEVNKNSPELLKDTIDLKKDPNSGIQRGDNTNFRQNFKQEFNDAFFEMEKNGHFKSATDQMVEDWKKSKTNGMSQRTFDHAMNAQFYEKNLISEPPSDAVKLRKMLPTDEVGGKSSIGVEPIGEGSSGTRTVGEGSSETRAVGEGSSETRAVGEGSSETRSVSEGSSETRAVGEGSSETRAVGEGSSETRSVSEGSSETRAVGEGSSETRAVGEGSSETRAVGEGSSETRAVGEGSSETRSVSEGSSGTRSVSEGSSGTRSVGEGLSGTGSSTNYEQHVSADGTLTMDRASYRGFADVINQFRNYSFDGTKVGEVTKYLNSGAFGAGVIGVTFVNDIFDGLAHGVDTGDWSKFNAQAKKSGKELVIGTAAFMAGMEFTSAAAVFFATPVLGELALIGAAAFLAYQGGKALGELAGKLYKFYQTHDLIIPKGISNWFNNLKDKFFLPFFDLPNEIKAFKDAGKLSSPLILDLDHSGKIETTSLEYGTYFNLNNEEQKEKTAWVGKEDGLLVLDKNFDDKIDTGNELFGNYTVNNSGERANNGFDALNIYDVNHDSKIDSNDTIYQKLQVWQDKNGNGTVELGELSSLSDLGITSINTDYSNTYNIDDNGNAHNQKSSFTWKNGKNGIIEDVWFQTDVMQSLDETPDDSNFSEEIKNLPDLQQLGNMERLHVSMANDKTGHLTNLVKEFTTTSSIAQKEQLIDDIIYQWAGVSDIRTNSIANFKDHDDRLVLTLEKLMGEKLIRSWGNVSGPDQVNALEKIWTDVRTKIFSELQLSSQLNNITPYINFEVLNNKLQLNTTALYEHLKTLPDVESASIAFTIKNGMNQGSSIYQQLQMNAKNSNDQTKFQQLLLNHAHLYISNDQQDIRIFSDNEIQSTLLKKYKIYSFEGNPGEIFDGNSQTSILIGNSGNDLYLFSKGHGQDTIYDYEGQNLIQFTNVKASEVTFSKDNDDLILSGYNGTDSVRLQYFFSSSDYQGESFIFNDQTIDAKDVFDMTFTFNGTSGNDYMSTWSGKSIVNAGDGNDTVTASDKDDSLDGGTGNDTLNGGAGNDTYIFSKGHGQDTVYDYQGQNLVQFTDIKASEVTFSKDNSDLILSGYNGTDSVRLQYFFSSSDYQGESFIFNDQTIDAKDVFDMTFTVNGTSGNDMLKGGAGNDLYLFSKGHGQDTIYDYEGQNLIQFTDVKASEVTFSKDNNDLILSGYNGTDSVRIQYFFSLSSYQGESFIFNDQTIDAKDVFDMTFTVNGTSGNDMLKGGAGNDLYLFSKGHGQDTIYDYEGQNLIQFTDVKASEVTFSKDNDDLILSGYNGSDSVRVQYFFSSSDYQGESFIFNDQTIGAKDVFDMTFVFNGTSGNGYMSTWIGKSIVNAGGGDDTVYTSDKDDYLDGGADNDTLNAGGGNDILVGGTGNDTLNGGAGNDTYLFSKGHGQDTIYDYEGQNLIQFTDVKASEVTFSKDNDDLILSGYNGSDSVRVQYFFSSSDYQGESFIFNDQTLSFANIFDMTLTFNGTLVDDYLTTWNSKNIVYAQDGNDTVYTEEQDDIVYGGKGNDNLYTNAGNDILSGDEGDDHLDGNIGNDTYLFSRGHGNDTIVDFDTHENTDQIKLSDVASTEVSFTQDGSDLVLDGYESGDSIRVQDFF
ncbi:calcium-binding protein, partial [Acinetobacter sp. HY1485]|uniref:calcium-binding protein n=1 Tax=Acinetobacter sp. HY1485 TaxID=2970918 RepID=UPI0022B96572